MECIFFYKCLQMSTYHISYFIYCCCCCCCWSCSCCCCCWRCSRWCCRSRWSCCCWYSRQRCTSCSTYCSCWSCCCCTCCCCCRRCSACLLITSSQCCLDKSGRHSSQKHLAGCSNGNLLSIARPNSSDEDQKWLRIRPMKIKYGFEFVRWRSNMALNSFEVDELNFVLYRSLWIKLCTLSKSMN